MILRNFTKETKIDREFLREFKKYYHYYLKKKYQISSQDVRENIICEVLAKINNIIESWQSNRSSFCNYVNFYIRKEAIDYLKKLNIKNSLIISLEQDDNNDGFLYEYYKNNNDINNVEMRLLINEILLDCDEITRKILIMRFGLNGNKKYSIDEIAKKLNTTKRSITNKIYYSLITIRKSLKCE